MINVKGIKTHQYLIFNRSDSGMYQIKKVSMTICKSAENDLEGNVVFVNAKKLLIDVSSTLR